MLRAFADGESTVATEMEFPVSIDVDAARLSPRFRLFDFGAQPRAHECVQHQIIENIADCAAHWRLVHVPLKQV